MKIISSKSVPKDRYDYLVYKYGVDPLVTFNRNIHKSFNSARSDSIRSGESYFYFCGKVFNISVTDKSDKEILKTYYTRYPEELTTLTFKLNECNFKDKIIEDFVQKYKLPYFVFNSLWGILQPLEHFFPISNFTDFPLSDQEIYTEVYNFLLSLNEPSLVEVSNTVKIQQAGFDLKTSFRHRV